MGQPRVIVVSNRLPMTIMQTKDGLRAERSLGGLATALGATVGRYDMRWIGWGGLDRPLTAPEKESLHIPQYLVPVAIEPSMFERYYTTFANGVMWPLLHGLAENEVTDKRDWLAAQSVVCHFADVVMHESRPGDLIWVHDYHLLLLPGELARRGLKNRLGFFLHTPFPSPARFMAWKHHAAMLDSLLAADVIGFQTARDVRHFTQALASTGRQLRPGAIAQAFPIGMDISAYKNASDSPAIVAYQRRVKRICVGRQLILSVSRLDYTKGIVEQVRAFTRAVEQGRLDNVLYRLIVAPSRETRREYRELKRDIRLAVRSANTHLKQLGRTSHITFAYRSHGFEELSAWYGAADVLLVTPLIDGMNLVAKEYVAARGNQPGAIVLSQTAGAAAQLNQAIIVPPRDIAAIAAGITQALQLSEQEKRRRWRSLYRSVEQQDIFWWTDAFLSALH